MRHAILVDNQPQLFDGKFAIDSEGTQHPLRNMTAAQKASYGVYEVERELAIPIGIARTSSEMVFEDGKVIERAITEPLSQEQLGAAVNKERDQRIHAGASFPVPGLADPIPLTGRPFDQTVYLALLTRASGLKAAGVTDPVLRLRDGADVIHMLTPDQMIALVSQAMAWFEAVMAVSWDMKDGTAPFEDGIPADYSDDKRWPT